jgi:hypothetical protein
LTFGSPVLLESVSVGKVAAAKLAETSANAQRRIELVLRIHAIPHLFSVVTDLQRFVLLFCKRGKIAPKTRRENRSQPDTFLPSRFPKI